MTTRILDTNKEKEDKNPEVAFYNKKLIEEGSDSPNAKEYINELRSI